MPFAQPTFSGAKSWRSQVPSNAEHLESLYTIVNEWINSSLLSSRIRYIFDVDHSVNKGCPWNQPAFCPPSQPEWCSWRSGDRRKTPRKKEISAKDFASPSCSCTRKTHAPLAGEKNTLAVIPKGSFPMNDYESPMTNSAECLLRISTWTPISNCLKLGISWNP